MNTDTSFDNLNFDYKVDCNDESAPNQQEVIASLSHSLSYRLSDSTITYARNRFIRSSDLVDKIGLAQALLIKATNGYPHPDSTANSVLPPDLSTIGKAVRTYLTSTAQKQLAVLEQHTQSRIAIIQHLVEQENTQALATTERVDVMASSKISEVSHPNQTSNSSDYHNNISNSSNNSNSNSISTIESNLGKATALEELQVKTEQQFNATDQDLKKIPQDIATSPVTRAILEASRLASSLMDTVCEDGLVGSASVAGTESILVVPSYDEEKVDFSDYTSLVRDSNYGVEDESLKVTIAEFGDKVLEILAKVGHISAAVKTDSICKQTKYDASIVTNVDLAISEYLSQALEELTGYPVVSEESICQFPYDVRKDFGCYWLIDPLDGTKGFALGNNYYCHMVSFIQNNESVFSCIYVPKYEHQFVIGGKGQGVYSGQCYCEFYQDLENTTNSDSRDCESSNSDNFSESRDSSNLKTSSNDNANNLSSNTKNDANTVVAVSVDSKFLGLEEFIQLVNTNLEQAFNLKAIVHQNHLRSCGWDYVRGEELHQASVDIASQAQANLMQAQVLSGVNQGILECAYEQDLLQILNYYKNTIRPFYNTYLNNSLEDLVKTQEEKTNLNLDAKAKASSVEFRYNLLPNLAPVVLGSAQDRDDSVFGQGLHTFQRLGDFSVASNPSITTSYSYDAQQESFNQRVLPKTVLQNYKLSYTLIAPKLILLTGSAGITLVGKQSLALKSNNFVNEVKTSAGLKTFEVVTRRECSYLLGGLMSEWDLAPAMCLLRELGGVVLDLATAKYLPPAIFNKRHLDVLPCLMVTDPVQIPYLMDLMELAHLQVPQHINSYLLAKFKKHQASCRFVGELYDGYRLIDPV